MDLLGLPRRVDAAALEQRAKFSTPIIRGIIMDHVGIRYRALMRQSPDDAEEQILAEIAELHPALVSNNGHFSLPAVLGVLGQSINGGTKINALVRERVRKILEADPRFIDGRVVPVALIHRNAEQLQALLPQPGRNEWLAPKSVPADFILQVTDEMLLDQANVDIAQKVQHALNDRELYVARIHTALGLEAKKSIIRKSQVECAIRHAFVPLDHSKIDGLVQRQRQKSGHIQS